MSEKAIKIITNAIIDWHIYEHWLSPMNGVWQKNKKNKQTKKPQFNVWLSEQAAKFECRIDWLLSEFHANPHTHSYSAYTVLPSLTAFPPDLDLIYEATETETGAFAVSI